MTDLISRADAIDALYRSSVYSWSVEQDQSAHTWALNIIAKLPSADAVQGEWHKTDAAQILQKYVFDDGECIAQDMKDYNEALKMAIEALSTDIALPSAEAVSIHKDGTLEVKVPNAQKVGRVLVMDTDSHIGGGLFYPDDAVSREDYEEVKAYMDTLVDAFIEDGEELAESVKVVRCKDCKHYIVEGITTQYGWCHEYKHSVDEDDYCSYGERRKE